MTLILQDNNIYNLTKRYEPVFPRTILHKIKPLEHNTSIGTEARVAFRLTRNECYVIAHVTRRFPFSIWPFGHGK